MSSLGLQFSEMLTYIPLTPFAFALALRYPVQRSNWGRRSLLHLAGGLVVTVAHVILRGVTPYATWDGQVGDWVSAIGHSQAHAFQAKSPIFETLFLFSAADDIMFVYVPIVLIVHAVSYHQSFRNGELRESQLEAQLAKARLHALKSQMEPHFLFKTTLHSISSLMLTDVTAADHMMSLLSDLLRMSLANSGAQITTLSDELDFVNGYLEIEKIRFEDRLKVVLDIAPDTLDAQVPHLVLQPLVENAIRHGVSRGIELPFTRRDTVEAGLGHQPFRAANIASGVNWSRSATLSPCSHREKWNSNKAMFLLWQRSPCASMDNLHSRNFTLAQTSKRCGQDSNYIAVLRPA